MSIIVKQRVRNSFPEGSHRARITKVSSGVPSRFDRRQDLIEVELEGKEAVGVVRPRASVLFAPVLQSRLLMFVEAATGRELIDKEKTEGVDLETLIGKELVITVQSNMARFGYRYHRIIGFSPIGGIPRF